MSLPPGESAATNTKGWPLIHGDSRVDTIGIAFGRSLLIAARNSMKYWMLLNFALSQKSNKLLSVKRSHNYFYILGF